MTDAADVLDPIEKTYLAEKLQEFDRVTRHQMIVVTVPTLKGEDIAAFTRNLGNTWQIGRRGYNDGVILLVAPNEHRVRIAVGYGLEKELPDSVCSQIIDEQVLPRFRNDDLSGGINAGVDALIAHLES